MKTIIKSDLSIFTPFALDTFCHKVVLGCIDYCKQLLRTWSITYQERNVFFCVVFFQKRGNALKGIIHLVCLQNIPKDLYFLPPDTQTYVCVSGVKKY